jgi:hypothetical protein
MGMLELLFGKKKAVARPRHSRPAASTQFAPSQSTTNSNPHQVRKDLLKLVLREMMLRNGIPNAWLTADLLRTTNSQREQGVHVRFLMRHFEPRLLQHGVALEQDFLQRLQLLDPQARTWLMGFSWQFALENTAACPSLPHAGYWIAPPAEPVHATTAVEAEAHSGDVISGPVRIPQPVDEVRADLERLFALRDDDMKRHGVGDNFAPTRPSTL